MKLVKRRPAMLATVVGLLLASCLLAGCVYGDGPCYDGVYDPCQDPYYDGLYLPYYDPQYDPCAHRHRVYLG